MQVPGRVGDACVAGGGAYAETGVGGCGSTGDGDIHLRFLPCFQVLLLNLRFWHHADTLKNHVDDARCPAICPACRGKKSLLCVVSRGHSRLNR